MAAPGAGIGAGAGTSEASALDLAPFLQLVDAGHHHHVAGHQIREVISESSPSVVPTVTVRTRHRRIRLHHVDISALELRCIAAVGTSVTPCFCSTSKRTLTN